LFKRVLFVQIYFSPQSRVKYKYFDLKNWLTIFFFDIMLSSRNGARKQMIVVRFRNIEREELPSPKIDDFARASSLCTRKREACQLIGGAPIFGEWTERLSNTTLFDSSPSSRLALDREKYEIFFYRRNRSIGHVKRCNDLVDS